MRSPNTIVDVADVQRVEAYRRRKETAVLAIVFTDIVRSTNLREELGEVEYEQLREQHDEMVGDLVMVGDAGSVVKSTGDGFLAVFSEPSLSVERSLDIQGAFRDHLRFRLRIGVDMGQVS